MNIFHRFSQLATLCGCALLLCFSFATSADELQDINKLFKQGKQEQALGRINTFLAGKPKDAQARFLKGLILTEQDKTDEAIRVFSDLTEDFPELPEPYNNLAVLYASQGQYDKARISLEMAIRTHPSYATAHENLGDIYAKMASQAYDRALQLDHANASTQTKLSMIKDIFASSAGKGSKAGKAPRKPQVAAIPAAAANATPSVQVETVSAPPVATPHPAPSAPVATVAAVTAPPAVLPDPVIASPSKPAAHKSTLPNNSNDVLKRVHGWASAWSGKNVKSYLAYYAEDFKIPGGGSRAGWEAQRNERINKPKSIQVGIISPKVKFIDDSHASVSFKQSYRTSQLKTSTAKTLILEKSGDKWLIQDERTGK